MMHPDRAAPPIYVCGHSPFELSRLDRQDRLYGDVSRQMLAAAGLAEGMRVLDLGCGGGGLSVLAASLVGGRGCVVGVDRSAAVLETARSRASALGFTNVEFAAGEIDDLSFGRGFDALVGRFVLMHQPSPGGTLRSALHCLRGEPRVAFLESDLAATLALAERRSSAACSRVLRLKIGIIEAAEAHTDLGLRMGEVFAEAGLPAPGLKLHAPVEAGQNSELIPYLIDSLRSLSASAARLGVPSVPEAELESLAEQMEADSARGVPVLAPVVVSAVL